LELSKIPFCNDQPLRFVRIVGRFTMF